MKKIISLFVFVFLFSQLCFSQATLLENSSHTAGNVYAKNQYLGTDGEHSYYWHIAMSGIFFIVSDKNGNCEKYENLAPPISKVQKTYPMPYFVFFNGKAYIAYWVNVVSQKWKLYIIEWPKDGKLIPEKSVELEESPSCYNVKIAINSSSTEIAFGYNVFNASFEKIRTANFDFGEITETPHVRSELIDDNKFIVILDNWKNTKYNIAVYDFQSTKTKVINIPVTKRIVFDTSRTVVFTLTGNSNGDIHMDDAKVSTDANYKFKNGILYMFGRVSNEVAPINGHEYVTGLVCLNIDIEKGTCLIKYLSGTGVKEHFADGFTTMGIEFNSDESFVVYNNYNGYPYKEDTIECIKFDREMKMIWRRKISVIPDYHDFENTGFVFYNNKLIYLYVPPASKGSQKEIIGISFDEESGNATKKTLYQFDKGVTPNFVSLGVSSENSLFLEMDEGKVTKFLKIPF